MDTSTASQISIITSNDKFMDMRQNFLCADFELLRKVNFKFTFNLWRVVVHNAFHDHESWSAALPNVLIQTKHMQHNGISVRSIYVDKSNHRKNVGMWRHRHRHKRRRILILTFKYEFLDTRQNFSARLQLLHQVIHPRRKRQRHWNRYLPEFDRQCDSFVLLLHRSLIPDPWENSEVKRSDSESFELLKEMPETMIPPKTAWQLDTGLFLAFGCPGDGNSEEISNSMIKTWRYKNYA